MSERSRPVHSQVTVEICVGDAASAVAAEAGGACRVEMCDYLAAGGTTPSAGAIAVACQRLSIPVHVLIRPRAGDFVYSALELAVMRHDIEIVKTLGAAGVVVGVLTAQGAIDREQLAALAALARPLSLTFHKAFDQVRDQFAALDVLMELGVDRVLTSGGRLTALDGIENLAALVTKADGRLAIMAGGRLDEGSLPRVIREGNVGEVHLGSAVSEMVRSAMTFANRDDTEALWQRVDARRVARIVEIVRGLECVDQSTSG